MPKGKRGGRRAGGRSLDSILKNTRVTGDPGNVKQQAFELLNAAQTVFDDFGIEGFTAIDFNETKGALFNGEKAMAGVNGFNQLTINKKSLAKPVQDSNGYYTSDTIAGTGAHEAGHRVVNHLIQDVLLKDATNLQKANARHDMKIEKAIIKESKKRYGSNPPISGYGSTKFSEKVAEAISDVYTNKNKANPYSKVIVDVCKDINNGKFKPKINVK